jgi:hypothetical protein
MVLRLWKVRLVSTLKNYDEVIGTEICKKRIENKLWELEGYCLQKELGRL